MAGDGGDIMVYHKVQHNRDNQVQLYLRLITI